MTDEKRPIRQISVLIGLIWSGRGEGFPSSRLQA